MPAIAPRYETVWEILVDYLASHSGRWVQGWELADAVYGGYCERSAIPKLVARARRFFPIESSRLGYRIGKPDVAAATCPKCGTRRIRYGAEAEWICFGCPSTSVVDLEVGRTPYAEGSRGGKQWTEAEIERALELNETHTFDAIGRELNRSGDAVRGLYDSLGVKKRYVLGRRAGSDA